MIDELLKFCRRCLAVGGRPRRQARHGRLAAVSDWPALTRSMPPQTPPRAIKPAPHIKISSPSGKTPTPTSPSTSKPKRSMRSCSNPALKPQMLDDSPATQRIALRRKLSTLFGLVPSDELSGSYARGCTLNNAGQKSACGPPPGQGPSSSSPRLSFTAWLSFCLQPR